MKQEKLLAFVKDPKNIAKAVEGSMEKRQAVMEQSECWQPQCHKQSLAKYKGCIDHYMTAPAPLKAGDE